MAKEMRKLSEKSISRGPGLFEVNIKKVNLLSDQILLILANEKCFFLLFYETQKPNISVYGVLSAIYYVNAYVYCDSMAFRICTGFDPAYVLCILFSSFQTFTNVL